MAIEYYESMEEIRYKDYQNRLNILLSQPEILKKMNQIYTKRNQSFCEDNINQPKENYARKIQKDVIK